MKSKPNSSNFGIFNPFFYCLQSDWFLEIQAVHIHTDSSTVLLHLRTSTEPGASRWSSDILLLPSTLWTDECTELQAITFALIDVSYNHLIITHNFINLPLLFCFFMKLHRISSCRFTTFFITRSIHAVVNCYSAAQAPNRMVTGEKTVLSVQVVWLDNNANVSQLWTNERYQADKPGSKYLLPHQIVDGILQELGCNCSLCCY